MERENPKEKNNEIIVEVGNTEDFKLEENKKIEYKNMKEMNSINENTNSNNNNNNKEDYRSEDNDDNDLRDPNEKFSVPLHL